MSVIDLNDLRLLRTCCRLVANDVAELRMLERLAEVRHRTQGCRVRRDPSAVSKTGNDQSLSVGLAGVAESDDAARRYPAAALV